VTTDRFEITEDAWGEPLINGNRAIMWSDTALIGAIRQQARDLNQLRTDMAAAVAERDSFRSECALLTHKVICCGVAATHSDAGLSSTGAYASIWNSAQAESVRKLRAECDTLRARLAAIEAAPTVARVIEVDDRDFASGPHRTLVYCNDELPKHGSELISRPAKD